MERQDSIDSEHVNYPPQAYFVFGQDGQLFHLDQMMIVRDLDSRVQFDLDEWTDLQPLQGTFSGAVVATSKSFGADDVIVLEYQTECGIQRNWFLRCQFEWSATPGHVPKVGACMLWQIPHPACMGMILTIKDHQEKFGENEPHELVNPNDCYPTCSVFRPEDHVGNGTKPVTKLLQWPRQVAVMSMVPNNALAYPNGQKTQPVLKELSCARPMCFRRKPCDFFEKLSDDVTLMILENITSTLVKRPDGKRDLLNLRLVNKTFKQEVDAAAVSWTRDTYDEMVESIHSGSVSKLQTIGRTLNDAGVCACTAYKTWVEQEWAKQSDQTPKPITFKTFLRWKYNLRFEPTLKSPRTRPYSLWRGPKTRPPSADAITTAVAS